MRVNIEQVAQKHYREIFDFENRNKIFFETILPPRSEGYYHFESFIKIMDDLIAEQNQGDFIMFIIRNELNQFVGRINLQLTKSDRGAKADLGYRIDMNHQGMGYASQAVALIVEKAFNELEIYELTAGTGKNNYGSQRVLVKNGFEEVGQEKSVFRIQDQFVDGILYSIKNISL